MKPKFIALLGLFLTAPAHAAITAGTSIYIDFGPNAVNGGVVTTSPATNGIYWNNAGTNVLAGGGGTPTAPADLVSSTNVATGVNLTFSNNWQANSVGGLADPTSALLGDFAVGTVTTDYIFHNKADSGANATITINNLDTSLTYNFKIFATRDNTQTRITQYTIGSTSTTLQTSGTGIGNGGTNGNNNQFATFSSISPSGTGKIILSLTGSVTDFAYIAGLQLTAVPEPGAALLGGLGGLLLLSRRRRAAL
ncbi:MAG: hypothetical protein EOP87_14200 [Verrucomicrobiaceae bacterium]|nr:MAG: hypothetical protein EOP87_14200 [Verrucomicrobiaceae bacterium]